MEVLSDAQLGAVVSRVYAFIPYCISVRRRSRTEQDSVLNVLNSQVPSVGSIFAEQDW